MLDVRSLGPLVLGPWSRRSDPISYLLIFYLLPSAPGIPLDCLPELSGTNNLPSPDCWLSSQGINLPKKITDEFLAYELGTPFKSLQAGPAGVGPAQPAGCFRRLSDLLHR